MSAEGVDVAALRGQVADLLDLILLADDPENAARLWVELEALRHDAAEAERQAAEHVAAVMAGHDLFNLRLDDLPPIVRYTPKARKAWRWDEVWPEVRKIITEEPRLLFGSGEPEADFDVALRVARECLSVSAVKVTAFKNRGRDVDEFATTEVGTERARLDGGRRR